MRPLFLTRLFLVSLACSLIVPCLRADEAGGDLQPIFPLPQSLFHNRHPFRNFDFDNGSAQVMSRDGKLLLTAGEDGLMVWDLRDRPEAKPRRFDAGMPDLFDVVAALSADGKTAAVVSMHDHGGDPTVRFFDTTTGKQTREIDNDEQISGLALAPDSRLLAVSTRQRIEWWNAEDGSEVRVSPAGQDVTYCLLTFSPDGKMLAALAQEANTIHIWETASGKERASLHFGGPSRPAPAGRRRRRVIRPPDEDSDSNSGILALALSADNRFLAASTQDSTIHLWDLQTGREAPPLTGFRGNAGALVFSPDGEQLIALNSEGTRLTWPMNKIRRSQQARLAPLSDVDFRELWSDLAEPDLFREYRARRHLVADPKRALKLLADNLKPVLPGDSARIRELLKSLKNTNAGTRRQAMMELRTKHGEAALGALRQKYGNRINEGDGRANAALILMQKLDIQFDTPERARDLKGVQILEEIGTPEARLMLEKLAKGAAGVRLTTEAKAALDRLTAANKERPQPLTQEQLWADLASNDASRAFQAMCGLSAAPQQAVDLFQKHLKPVPVVEEKEIAALLTDLEADDFKKREQATQELERVCEQALPWLKKALAARPSLEARKRIERLVEQASAQTTATLLRDLRAIEVLEQSGTAEGRRILDALAGGAPQARLTREAKSSLHRLTR